jgi:hypothetical protein
VNLKLLMIVERRRPRLRTFLVYTHPKTAVAAENFSQLLLGTQKLLWLCFSILAIVGNSGAFGNSGRVGCKQTLEKNAPLRGPQMPKLNARENTRNRSQAAKRERNRTLRASLNMPAGAVGKHPAKAADNARNAAGKAGKTAKAAK